MSGLSLFALIILIILLACGVFAWVMLGLFPGKIARQRNHPQAEAINICGWFGALTLGILSPLAFIWAYTRVDEKPGAPASARTDEEAGA